MRRALVQGNRDIGLVNLMQIGEASAEDLEWCTLNRVETSSDLQYISAAHTPQREDVGAPVEEITKTTIGDCGLDPTGRETYTPGCVREKPAEAGQATFVATKQAATSDS